MKVAIYKNSQAKRAKSESCQSFLQFGGSDTVQYS